MKLYVKDGSFKNTEGQEIAFKQIMAHVELNGFEHDINIKFTDTKGNKVKLVHDIVIDNIEGAELIVESSVDSKGTTWYNPYVVVNVNGKEQKLKPNLSASDSFILCVYLFKKDNKR